jgi:hypothetical protein
MDPFVQAKLLPELADDAALAEAEAEMATTGIGNSGRTQTIAGGGVHPMWGESDGSAMTIKMREGASLLQLEVMAVLTLYSDCTHTVLILYSNCTHTVQVMTEGMTIDEVVGTCAIDISELHECWYPLKWYPLQGGGELLASVRLMGKVMTVLTLY